MTTPNDMPEHAHISGVEQRRIRHNLTKRLEAIARRVRTFTVDDALLLHEHLDAFREESRELRDGTDAPKPPRRAVTG